MKKLGYIPPMTKGLTDDRRYVIPFVEMLEEVGVESVRNGRARDHGDELRALYPYSEDGQAPTGPDTLMPDPRVACPPQRGPRRSTSVPPS
ncbi:MAG: hypothetical protein R3E53_06275 [Myxococcota bacterium]